MFKQKPYAKLKLCRNTHTHKEIKNKVRWLHLAARKIMSEYVCVEFDQGRRTSYNTTISNTAKH